jgi:hypothetical protein
VDVKLVNNSGVLFKSVSITVTDTTTNPVTIVAQEMNGFMHNDGCSSPVTTNTLVAGASVTISSPQFAYNPSGHTLVAKVTICSEVDQKGTCLMREINFKP